MGANRAVNYLIAASGNKALLAYNKSDATAFRDALSYIVGGQHANELRSAMRIAMDAEVPGAATNFDRAGHPYVAVYQKSRHDTGHTIHMAQGIQNVRRSAGYLARRDAFWNRQRSATVT
jgi:hypothetical protein